MRQESRLTAAAELRTVVKGKVLLPTDDKYLEATKLWNSGIAHQPAIIVLCQGTKDVQAAVSCARKFHLPLSVRGGGHDWAGRALVHQGIVIDLTMMNNISISANAKIAVAQGGAKASDLINAADPYDLVAVTGNVGAVGLAGLTLGGGYGPLAGRFGLALDNLLGVQVVLGDGSIVTASETENPDLFWACRGGGGNFGVVTSMTIRLHPAEPNLHGMILYKWEDAPDIFKKLETAIRNLPDELYLMAGLRSAPDGTSFLYFSVNWFGVTEKGRNALSVFQELGTPIMAQVEPMRFKDVLALADANLGHGEYCFAQTRTVSQLSLEVLEKIVRAGNNKTSHLSKIAWFHLHGQPTKIPLPSTAFGNRQEHFALVVNACWSPGDNSNAEHHRQWARDLSAAWKENAVPGGYANLLDPGETEQAAHAYGTNLSRLQKLKKRYDPDGIFNAIPLPV